MSTATAQAKWHRFNAGERVRCFTCTKAKFATVLPAAVTWVCPKPPYGTVPPPGGHEYTCRLCGDHYWGFTVPDYAGATPPELHR